MFSLMLRGFFLIGLCFALPAVAVEVPAPLKTPLKPPKLSAKSWLLLDYQTGWVLAQKNADDRIEPASLSKLMTAYVVFKELRKGTLKLTDQVHVSKKAWRTGGSRMFIQVNTKVAVEDLLKGMIIQSGNDAAVALAEHVAGTEDAFALRMNDYAKKLGIANTHFTNAPGLTDPNHYSAAYDLSVLAAAIIREFPDYYQWYSQKEFVYNKIRQGNRNLLLYRDATVDGVKTGHTSSAGYCLVGSAVRNNMRLIATVTGTASPKRRAKEVQALLKYGFSSYESKKLLDAGAAVAQVTVYKGVQAQVPLGVIEPLYVTVPRGKAKKIKTAIQVPEYLVAPVQVRQTLGKFNVLVGDEMVFETPLVATAAVPTGAWWQRIVDSVLLWFE